MDAPPSLLHLTMGEVNDGDLLKKLEEDYYEHKGALEDLGKEALKKALTDHFTAELQDDPDDRISIPDLVKFHLSQYNLKNTFRNLYSKGLIQVRKVKIKQRRQKKRETGKELMAAFPIIIMMDHAVLIGISSFEDVDASVWERTFKKVIPKGQCVNSPRAFQALEKETGFEVGMYKYALQVAGLMYITSLRNDVKFWESYKPYMSLLPKDQLGSATLKAKSKVFEKKRAFVVEGVPRFMGFITTLAV